MSRDHWILVKKYLTAGETRAVFRRMILAGSTPMRVDPIEVDRARAIGYLVDWSITDADDRPVVIAGQDPEVVAAALDNLIPDRFKEIATAIEAHEDQMTRARDEEKKMVGATP